MQPIPSPRSTSEAPGFFFTTPLDFFAISTDQTPSGVWSGKYFEEATSKYPRRDVAFSSSAYQELFPEDKSFSAAGAISVRPEAAGTASGAMGFLQMGVGALVSQFGAWLGGHFSTPVPLNIAIVVLSAACASTMIFLVPRRDVVVSEALIEQAEEEESGLL